MNASDRCLDLIKEFEGFASEPYEDVAGYRTWGYGHKQRKGEAAPATISEADATRLLCNDIQTAECCVSDAVEVALNQNRFDALCSFVFNLGGHAFEGSTLLKLLNAGDYSGASGEFPKWCRAGQNQVPGLLRRRLAEQLLFDTP